MKYQSNYTTTRLTIQYNNNTHKNRETKKKYRRNKVKKAHVYVCVASGPPSRLKRLR